jgi:hypothetical protein
MSAKEKTGVFTPKKEIVIVKPNLTKSRNKLVDDPEHEAYFLMGTSSVHYSLPKDTQGNLINPFLTEGDKEWLEDSLDLDLNYHKRTDNFWKSFKVKLSKKTQRLDLANPKDYLTYLVLKANHLHIAPNENVANKRATYRYIMTTESFDMEKKASSVDKSIRAYMELGKIVEDKAAMANFLKVYGKKVSAQSKIEFFVAEIKKIIEEDIDTFLRIIEDKENYELKLLIADAVEIGAIKLDKRQYTLPGGDALAEVGQVPTLENAIKFLKYKGNQELLMTIKARVDNTKD